MLRFLIFIFALNTFASPVSASIACEMMGSVDMVSMNHVMDESSYSEISCDTNDTSSSCSGTDCASNCFTTTPSAVLGSVQTLDLHLMSSYKESPPPFLYQLFLPVKHPPPLV